MAMSPSLSSKDEKYKSTVNMRFLCLGLCRTGTVSLKHALLQLGVKKVYHGGSDCFQEKPETARVWLRAQRAKYHGEGQPFGRKEFDGIFEGCEACADFPAIEFAEELVAAYPDAKVILTVRDADVWFRSMNQTLYPAVFKKSSTFCDLLATLIRSPSRWSVPVGKEFFGEFFHGTFPLDGKKTFHRHNEMVKRLVPSDRLLVFRVEEGWGPLCKFLGCEIPNTPFPNGNTTPEFRAKVKRITRNELGRFGRIFVMWVFLVSLVVLLWAKRWVY